MFLQGSLLFLFLISSGSYCLRAEDKNQEIQLTLTLDDGVHGCVCMRGGGLSYFSTLGHGTLFSLCGSLSNCRVFNIPGLIY